MSKKQKILTARLLIMYMITALLFLTSVELHIHTQDAAPEAEHGFAVSVTLLDGDFIQHMASEEIDVGTDSVLKVDHDTVSMMAVFILIATILVTLQRIFIGRLREEHKHLSSIPFRGLPPLRAPPL